MPNDDDRVAHLMGEPSAVLDETDRLALDDLGQLLADPSVWATPAADLEERVVGAVAGESATNITDMGRARRPRTGRWALVMGAAAAAVLVVAVAGSLFRGGTDAPRLQVALAAVGAPGPSGSATLTRTDSGWEAVLDAEGLPRLDNGRYYQAWLRGPDGTLVPLGSFNEGGRIVLWAGVSPIDFPGFTVTVEAADGNQASSGQRVLAGTVDPSS